MKLKFFINLLIGSFCFTLLLPLFQPSIFAQEQDSAIQQFLQCQGTFNELPSDYTFACQPNGQAQGVIFDNSDPARKPIRDAVMHIRFRVGGEAKEYIIPTNNGSYRFCTLNGSGEQLYPSKPFATEIAFSSPKHEKSEYWPLDQAQACFQTKDNSALGNVPLKAGTGQYSCFDDGACKAVGSGGTAHGKFATNSCDSQCGIYYLVDQNKVQPGAGLKKRCYEEDQLPVEKNDPAVLGGPFYLKSECVLEEEDTPPPTATPGPVNSPTPTTRPPKPPCYSKTVMSDELTECRSVFTGLGIELKTNPEELVQTLFTFFLSISGGILLAIIIWSGYTFMTSQGNPEKIQLARDRITSAIIGFLFLVFSVVILEVIGVDILRIPGFCRDGDTECQRETILIPPTPVPTAPVTPFVPPFGPAPEVRSTNTPTPTRTTMNTPAPPRETARNTPTPVRLTSTPTPLPPTSAIIPTQPIGTGRMPTATPTKKPTPTRRPTTTPTRSTPTPGFFQRLWQNLRGPSPTPTSIPRATATPAKPVCRQGTVCQSNSDCVRAGCSNHVCVIPIVDGRSYPEDAQCQPRSR